MQKYTTQELINQTEVEYKLLTEIETIQAICKFGMFREQPRNRTDTITFSRMNPFGMSATTGASVIDPQDHIYEEGQTPETNTITYTDVSATLQNFDVLMKYSSKTALFHEHKISDDMIRNIGRAMAQILEMVAYGQVKAGDSVVYANGSTRAGLNQPLSLPILRLAVRGMNSNQAMEVTTMIKSGPDYGTSGAPKGFICFSSTDCSSDIRDLQHFKEKEMYGSSRKAYHDKEIGVCEEFTFIVSPLLTPWLAAGAAYDGTMVSAAAANNDVYPMIVMAEDAWGHISLKGQGKTGIDPIHIPWDRESHYNPSRKFGFVGASAWWATVRLNEFFMTRIEVCATRLNQ